MVSHTRVGSDDPLLPVLGRLNSGIDAIASLSTDHGSPRSIDDDHTAQEVFTAQIPLARESVIPQDSRLRRTFSPWSALGLGFRHELPSRQKQWTSITLF